MDKKRPFLPDHCPRKTPDQATPHRCSRRRRRCRLHAWAVLLADWVSARARLFLESVVRRNRLAQHDRLLQESGE
ncbi:hypothetical protein E2C01_032559 [Portunus trituberculatus]|uniref:Uncharacterized protein n=1 Tax=Portunus trituberculatus TaxID=210409 RepID=A0A5B7EWB0_PORTR|nr:hypothetical protein [Portunus trituberculatus]